MSANRKRGEVTLELGGETYVLVPSFGAVCEIEDALGTNLFSIGRRLALAEITARELIDLAQACLAQAGAKLDRAELGEAILDAGTQEVMATFAEFCANYAFGGRREKKAPDAASKPQTPATGTPSPASSSAPA